MHMKLFTREGKHQQVSEVRRKAVQGGRPCQRPHRDAAGWCMDQYGHPRTDAPPVWGLARCDRVTLRKVSLVAKARQAGTRGRDQAEARKARKQRQTTNESQEPRFHGSPRLKTSNLLGTHVATRRDEAS